jgi:predicted ATP-dependent endonuclease of OLD family
MRVKSVGIRNFRCLDEVEVEFDQITTFIGPNGAGKSTVLRALDWFFNGDKSVVLTEEDVFSGVDDDKRIVVRVDFDQLSSKDRDLLGEKYAPSDVDTVTIWRSWDAGKDKITGKAMAFAPFEVVRATDGAGPRKAAYQQVISDHPELTFPAWTSDGASEELMSRWERENPDQLVEAQVSSTNFFGFAGQGKLSGLFDYVLITADMRASEESQDSKSSVIGRILEKAVDRSAANDELSALNDDLMVRHQEITKRYFDGQLSDLSAALTDEVSSFSVGRQVNIEALDAEFRPQTTKFRVRIDDHGTKTSVDRQGHGFQRSLLIAALKLLAQRGASAGDESVIFLAIEEPELFQHPAQAKSFAAVLRGLAEDSAAGVQVTYATHSPYFVEPTYFDQVRRVERDTAASGSSQVVVHHASMDRVFTILDGYLNADDVRRRLDNSCLNELRDALFGSAVLVVEGTTDRAVIEGIAGKSTPLAVNGVEVAVAGSKPQLFLPVAILRQLGIPHFVLFDSDSRVGERMRAVGKTEEVIATQETADAAKNRDVLRFLSLPEQDWPSGILSPTVGVIEDTLESLVTSTWPEFEAERVALISAGRGAEDKNSSTYALAAKLAQNEPAALSEMIDAVRALAP